MSLFSFKEKKYLVTAKDGVIETVVGRSLEIFEDADDDAKGDIYITGMSHYEVIAWYRKENILKIVEIK